MSSRKLLIFLSFSLLPSFAFVLMTHSASQDVASAVDRAEEATGGEEQDAGEQGEQGSHRAQDGCPSEKEVEL